MRCEMWAAKGYFIIINKTTFINRHPFAGVCNFIPQAALKAWENLLDFLFPILFLQPFFSSSWASQESLRQVHPSLKSWQSRELSLLSATQSGGSCNERNKKILCWHELRDEIIWEAYLRYHQQFTPPYCLSCRRRHHLHHRKACRKTLPWHQALSQKLLLVSIEPQNKAVKGPL